MPDLAETLTVLKAREFTMSADGRAALRTLMAEFERVLREVTPQPGFPKHERTCASRGSSYEEDSRCDCGVDEMGPSFQAAREMGAALRAFQETL